MDKGAKIVGLTIIAFGLMMAVMVSIVFIIAGLGGAFYAIPVGLFLFFGLFGLLCLYIMGGKETVDEKIDKTKECIEEYRDNREAKKNAGKCEYCGRPIGYDNSLHCLWCGAKLW